MSTKQSQVIEKKSQGKTIQISRKAIIVAVGVIMILVIGAYVLTFALPRGEYQRDANGSIIEGTYQENPELEGIKIWQFLLAPIMILSPSQPGSGMVYSIMLLLIVIGAIFTALDECGILIYMIDSISNRFKNKKYFLLFIMSFAFMFLGTAVGMFEELIPLVPIAVMLSYAMGWDAFIGLGISVLSACFGFATGVVNPFNVGISQKLGGIPMFSGMGLRLLAFFLSYIVLSLFLYLYAKKVEKHPEKSLVYKEDLLRKSEFDFENKTFTYEPQKAKALKWFSAWILVVIAIAIISIFWRSPVIFGQTLADYILFITVFVYIIAGVGAVVMCGVKGKKLWKLLGKGALTLLPAVAMILFAGGVRYIIEQGDVMDTILFKAITAISTKPPMVAVLLIYLIIFVFEIFIPSGSAKAMLIMPIIFNICSAVGIDGQVAVLAMAFADGFSNMLLPTNAGLLLILGMTTVNFPKWFKWIFPIVIVLLAITIGILALAQFVVYA